MSGFDNSRFIFNEDRPPLAQDSTLNSVRNKWAGSCLPYDTGIIRNSTRLSRGKRHLNDSEQLEEIEMPPWKKPASEEAVLKQLSNLNISKIGNCKATVNDVDMVTVEDVSDVSDAECNSESDNKCLILPDVLRRGYNLLKTHGSLPDPDLMKMASSSPTSSQYCLALVPYVPRPTLPPLPVSDVIQANSSPASSVDEDEDDGQEGKKDIIVEPMECAVEDQATTVPFVFNPTLPFPQLSTPGQPRFVYGRTSRPGQTWQLRIIR
ncbi:hypothetical protein Aperf_G00000069054 [Anoplocephala perfoliata]